MSYLNIPLVRLLQLSLSLLLTEPFLPGSLKLASSKNRAPYAMESTTLMLELEDVKKALASLGQASELLW